jgi:cytochrome c551/c552
VLSGNINLTQQMAVAHRDGSGGFDASDVVNVYKKVAQRYKDVNDARKQYEDMAKANTGKKWSDFILHAIGGLAKKKWLAALGPVAGILELVLGGGSSSENQPAPLILDGTLELNGKLTTLAPLYFVLMRVPGSHHIDVAQDELSNVLPLYDVPLGVFNVATEPRYNLYHRQTITDRWQNRWYGTVDVNNTEPLILEANLHVFKVTKANAGYSVPDWLVPYRPVGGFNSGTVTDVYSASGWSDILFSRWYPSMGSVRLALDVSLTPLDAPPGLEPVPVIKTYNPAHPVFNGVAPSFPGRPPARPSSLIAVPTTTGIDLRWIDNAGNESAFVVEWSPSGTGAWSEIANLGPNLTSLSVNNGTSGTQYDFRLRATGAGGSSSYSNLARATAP